MIDRYVKVCPKASSMVNTGEKLCLQWNDFRIDIATSFAELRGDRDLTDVTLVCEDGTQVEAHKVVLASCSTFFMEVLKKNKHPHPLIYMRALRSEDLMAIIEFLYNGEANIFQESLDSFLALAEDLQLKGLSGATEDQKEPETKLPQKRNVSSQRETFKQPESSLSKVKFEGETLPGSDPDKFDNIAVNHEKVGTDGQDLDGQIKSMITRSDIRSANGQGFLARCNICGKEGPFNTMPRHIEAYHIEGVSHACDICGKISRYIFVLKIEGHIIHVKFYYRTRLGLGVHRSTKHRAI